jgi:hypothetical protein
MREKHLAHDRELTGYVSDIRPIPRLRVPSQNRSKCCDDWIMRQAGREIQQCFVCPTNGDHEPKYQDRKIHLAGAVVQQS